MWNIKLPLTLLPCLITLSHYLTLLPYLITLPQLPYIGYYSSYTGRKISSFINKYCKDLNVKIIFSPFKLRTIFSPKYFVPDSLKSRVVYQFSIASYWWSNTRVHENLFRDKNSHIFKHLSASKGCGDKCDISCFKILDHASTYSQLKIKESFHTEQLNKQVEHVRLSLHF